jgi:hypothetical protein
MGPAQAHIRLEVTDNESTAHVEWLVDIIVAPQGLASIATPANGSQFSPNDTLSLGAGVAPDLHNATFEWRVDGAPVGTARNLTAGPLGEGWHNITLVAVGLYLGIAPYNETLHATVLVKAPAQPSTQHNTTAPPPAPRADGVWAYAAAGGAAAAAGVGAYLWLRRRRPEE